MGEKVYWQGMDKEVRNFINKCIAFQANTEMPNLTPLNVSELLKVAISRDFLSSLVSTDSSRVYYGFTFAISNRRDDENYKCCCSNL